MLKDIRGSFVGERERERSFWTWWGPNLNPAVDYSCSASREETRSVFHGRVFISPHSMIAARFASFLCPCQPQYTVFGRGASMKLCGLLRKTGAKIPAGPIRYSDARQWSGHFGTDWTHSAAKNKTVASTDENQILRARLFMSLWPDRQCGNFYSISRSHVPLGSVIVCRVPRLALLCRSRIVDRRRSTRSCVFIRSGSSAVHHGQSDTGLNGSLAEWQLDSRKAWRPVLAGEQRAGCCAYASLTVRAPDRSHISSP